MENSAPSFGVLYATAGEKHTHEAVQSAESVRRLMPEIPIVIWTDRPDLLPDGLFQKIHRLDHPTFTTMDRMLPMLNTPFEKTLYLDSDTLLLEPVEELASVLDRCEIAYTQAPRRRCCFRAGCGFDPTIPEWFVQPGAGVILYRLTDTIKRVLADWAKLSHAGLKNEPKNCGDQPSLWRALYHSTAKMIVLPPEYNYRTVCPSFAGQNYKVKILHGRGRNLDRARRFVNIHLQSRVANYERPHYYSDQFVPLVVRAIINRPHLYKFLARLNSAYFYKW
jgi:hypothetical protein